MLGTRARMRGFWAAAAALGAALLGGCSTISQADYDAALAEAQELRDHNATLASQLQECETRYAALDARNRELQARPTQQPTPDFGPGTTVRRGPGGELIVEVAGDVLFDSGSIVIKPAARQTLDRIASTLQRQFAGNLIRVEGYTDSDPIRRSKWVTNERLSAERAMAVEAYLVTKGIDNNRIYSAAFGPARPRATKALSRRVEIVVLGAGS